MDKNTSGLLFAAAGAAAGAAAAAVLLSRSRPAKLRPDAMSSASSRATPRAMTLGTSADGGGATINIGINGFGRIGRTVFRVLLAKGDATALRVVAINAPGKSAEYVCYALKHDSVFGRLDPSIDVAPDGEHAIIVRGARIALLDSRDPAQLDWRGSHAEYVVESTGAFTTSKKARGHLGGAKGARRAIITAPAKDDTPMLVMGVNHDAYDPARHDVVSMASCTTNCLAPLAHAVHEAFGIEEGLMTTVHSATGSQTTVDASPSGGKDWRAGRAALNNIIPASTGAATAVGRVIPALAGKLTGIAVRVPTVDVSMVDLTVRTRRDVDAAELHGCLRAHAADAASPLHGVVGVTDDAVVSQDFVGEARSCVLDAKACVSLSPRFHKLVAWYDNEWGYSSRVVDLVTWMAKKDAALPSSARFA